MKMRAFRRLAQAFLPVVLATAGALLIPSVRTLVLYRVGTALVAEDALAPADVIVIGPDAAETGTLEEPTSYVMVSLGV